MDVKQIKAGDLDVSGPFLDDGRIYVFDEFTYVERLEYVRLDGIFVILCVEGELTLSIDHRMFTARRNDIVIGVPEAVIGKAEASQDFKFRGLFMSLEYAFRMLPVSVRSWNFKVFFDQNPRISLGEAAVGTFNLYYGLLKQKLADKANPYRSHIVDALMQAFVFEFRSTFDNMARLSPRPLSSAENIFGDFIDLLSTAYPKPRSVSYYADRLNITPQYLSVVCKKVGARTPRKSSTRTCRRTSRRCSRARASRSRKYPTNWPSPTPLSSAAMSRKTSAALPTNCAANSTEWGSNSCVHNAQLAFADFQFIIGLRRGMARCQL